MTMLKRLAGAAALAAAIACVGVGAPAAAPTAVCSLPPGNAAQQWDAIAQTVAVGATGFQIEAFVYMAYANGAAYRAVFPGGPAAAPWIVSPDAAIATAESEVLAYYFPSQADLVSCYRDAALAMVPDGLGKLLGTFIGHRAALTMTVGRNGDGRLPIGTIEPSYPTAGPGVWQPTGPGFLPPQTPYLGRMKPFVLRSPDQYLPPPPPSLGSATWVRDFHETMTMGRATGSGRTQEQTDIARFYATNTVVQYNTAFRDVATQHGFDVVQSMRLIGAGSIVAADAGIACLNAKYHYWFWRPITAFNATAANVTDGNPATVEENGTWTPLLTTPNHPEYPAAHGCVTSAMAEVFRAILGTDDIHVTLTSTTSPAMPTRFFATADALQSDVVDARVWGGLHYRNSAEVGVALGRSVARFDLSHAFGLPGGAG
jgi:hypothetical protein